jgi:hypothetical protein
MNPITINHISFNAKSTLNILSDICAICREPICTKCTKCTNNDNDNDNDNKNICFSILGECNHAYHKCCIQTWIHGLASIRQKCPMCNQNWIMKKRSIHTSTNNSK